MNHINIIFSNICIIIFILISSYILFPNYIFLFFSREKEKGNGKPLRKIHTRILIRKVDNVSESMKSLG